MPSKYQQRKFRRKRDPGLFRMIWLLAQFGSLLPPLFSQPGGEKRKEERRKGGTEEEKEEERRKGKNPTFGEFFCNVGEPPVMI